MPELQWKILDAYVRQGDIELGRGNIISKDDIAADPGSYPIYSSSAHNNGKFGEYAKFMFDEEMVTWSVDGGGNFFYRPKHKFSVTNVCGYMRVRSKALNAHFVFYCLANQHASLTFDYTTKAHPSVIRKLYKIPELDVRVQERIANLLDTCGQAIEKTEALIEKYQQIKAGLMHDLFTRGIGADGKLRPPREQAPELYQETPIGWIPKDWQVSKMADLAMPLKGSTVIGPFGSDLVMSDYRSEGVPVVFVRDVKEDGFSWVSNVFVSSHKAQKLFAHRVNEGDLLVTKMGLPPCVSAVYSSDMPMGIITADMIRMSPDLSKVDANWLCASINHDRVKRQVAGITAGVTRPKVTLADFRSLKVAVPTLQEQQAVWTILGAIVKRLASETGQLEKLRLEKEGLMTDLLSGHVEVANV